MPTSTAVYAHACRVAGIIILYCNDGREYIIIVVISYIIYLTVVKR